MQMRSVFVLAACLAGQASFAQETRQTASTAPTSDQFQARYQISVMEGVLERAVAHGAQMLKIRMSSAVPNMVMVTGEPRARGFRLDGYGVFFYVEVPAVRQTLAWSFRMLDQGDRGTRSALESLRRHVGTLADQPARRDLEEALRRLEYQVAALAGGAFDTPRSPASMKAEPGSSPVTASSVEVPGASAIRPDPNETYTAEVKNALIDVMLDYSAPIAIGADEWFTIAARDNAGPLVGDPNEVTTIFLKVKGSDLAAFRAGRFTREEARKVVEVREF